MGISESVAETVLPSPGRQVLSSSPTCPEVGNLEGDVVDPVDGVMHPWLEKHISSGSSQRGPGAMCKGHLLMGTTCWIRAIVVCHWPCGERSPSFCVGRCVPLVRYARSATAYRGTQEVSAGAVRSEAHVLRWYYHGDWMPAAKAVPCDGSEKHLGAACQGSGGLCTGLV